MVEQSLFDGATRANVAAAGIGHDVATANRLMVDHDLAASVTAAYGRVLVAAAAQPVCRGGRRHGARGSRVGRQPA